MAIHDEDLLLISDSQDGNESKKIKYSTLKSNINGDSGNDLQAVTDNGNTTTNGAEFGGTVESSGPNRSFLAQRPDYTDGTTANGYSFAVIDCMDAGNKTTLRLAADGSIFGGSIGNNSVDHQLSNYALNSDGSAEFAGGAVEISAAGAISSNRTDGTRDCFTGELNGTATSQIKADGSASFAGDLTLNDGSGEGKILFGSSQQVFIKGLDVGNGGSTAGISIGDTTNGTKSSLFANGSADFAGTLSADSGKFRADNGLVHFNYPGYIAGTGENAYIDSDGGYISLASAAQITNGDAVFQIGSAADSNDIKARINADGSAEFKGVGTFNLEASRASSLRIQENGTTNTYFRNDGVAVFSDILSIGEDLQDPSPGCSIELNSDGSASFGSGNISLNASGSASFAGTVFSETGLRASGANSSIKVRQDGDGEVAFAVAQGSTLTEDSTIKFNGNGSASFEGTVDISSKALTEEGIRLKDSGRLQIRRDGSPSPNRVLEVYKDGNATSNITASIGNDGSASFSGDVDSSLNGFDLTSTASVGCRLGPGGHIIAKRNTKASDAKVFSGLGGTLADDETSTIFSDGSATFTTADHAGVSFSKDGTVPLTANSEVGFRINTDAIFGYEGAGEPTVEIRNDGSADFAGDVEVGVATGGDRGIRLYKDGGINVYNSADPGVAEAVWQVVDVNNDLTSMIVSDGSANFAGDVQIGGNPRDPDQQQGAWIGSNGHFFSRRTNDSDVVFTGGKPGSSDYTSSIFADGRAHFAGNVTSDGTIGFTLPDGSTYDIRERIEEALTRLTAIETADLTDDQEHSALLTLIANMSSRITALEAQLAGGN